MTTWEIMDGIDCGQNAKPEADLWREVVDPSTQERRGGAIYDRTPPAPLWGYSLTNGGHCEMLVCGFETEQAARQAAYDDVRERMQEAAADTHL